MRKAPSAASTGPASFLKLDAQGGVGLGHPADLVEEIHVPGAAAELAVGHPCEANLLLHAGGITDRGILDAAQFLGREPAGLMLGPARSNSGGRSRLPTWSARNGGPDMSLIATSPFLVAL